MMTKLTVTIWKNIFARLFATEPQFLDEHSQHIFEDFLVFFLGLFYQNIYCNVGEDDTDNVSDEEHGPKNNQFKV